MLERFFFALEIVRANRDSLENVLLSDSRDVVFQGNPFGHIDGHIVSGLEENTIGHCEINSSWIKQISGKDIHASMSNDRIVCAGVTLGPVGEVEKYLVEMCREIWRCLPKVALVAQFDQGIHNYLIYSGRARVGLTDNRDGIIATLHHEKPSNILLDSASGAVSVHGKKPIILHQYDRHRNLAAFVKMKTHE
jgi:hypothetical protein